MKKIIGITLGLVMGVALVAYATAPLKVTICHATSSEGNEFNTLHVSENAIGGHFENPGTPKAGHELDLFFEGEVECPTPPPPPVDVCPNIDGDQATVPEDKILVEGECVDPPVDVCPNIEGNQATVPEGKEIVNGECVDIIIPPDPVDLCNNIEGVQVTVPEGMQENDGVCAVPENPEEPPSGGGGGSSSGGSSSGSHRSSGGRTGGSISSASTCVLPFPISGFDVQSAIPNDGQNELVWNILNSYTVQPGDNFNPFTGISILYPVPGTVIYGDTATSVNIRWWQDTASEVFYSTISANDGFEAIGGLQNGTHHWFQLQPVNDCGVGDWGVAVDPLP